MQLFVYLNGTKRGPFSPSQIAALLAEGVLSPSDLAADSSGGEWKPLSAFSNALIPPPERAVLAPPPPSPSTAEPVAVEPAAAPALARDSLGAYARATLAPDESPVFTTSLHWIVFVRFALGGLLLFLFVALPFAIAVQAVTGSELGWFALPLPALVMLPPTVAFASSELVITDRRILIKTGILQRRTMEMFIAKVESVGVYQTFFGRMFDYGTVTLRGTGGSEEPFEAIAHPIEFRNSIQRLQTARL